MSRFSQSEAEAAGWSIVHQRDEFEVTVGPNLVQKTPATIVAEKYITRPGEVGRLIHEEAETMGKLLERIHAWEEHQKNIDAAGANVQPVPVDVDGELKTFSLLSGDEAEGVEVGDPVQSVVFPKEPGDLTLEAEVGTMTDAEWSARSKHDTLVTDEGQVIVGGGGQDVLDAEELRLLNKKAIEDRRAAEPAHGPVEQIEFDTAGLVDTPGIGAGGTVVVRQGEALDEVASRKEDLKKLREEGRVASMNEQGQAISPEGADKLAGLDVGIQERGDLGSEVPGQGAVARTLEELEDEVAADEAGELDVTDAAKAKAEELGIDLSQVKGTGKEGRIIAPDVEAAAEAATEPKSE